MEKNIDELRKELINALDEKTACENELNRSTGEKYELLRQKYEVLKEKCWLLREEVDYYDFYFIASDDEIELRRSESTIDGTYFIYLLGQGVRVGNVRYWGYSDIAISGNVSFVVNEQYDDKDYAYKAIVLLSDYLKKNGIPDFYITVEVDNKASLKTIIRMVMNYGGDIYKVNENRVTFRCLTKEKDAIKKKLVNN